MLGAFAVVVAALAVGAGVAALSPSVRTILLACIVASLAYPVVVRAVRGAVDPFEPIFVAALIYGVMFVLRPAWVIASDDFVYSIAGRGVGIDTTFDEMLLLAAAGAIGLVAGYETAWGERWAARLQPPRPVVSERRLLMVTLAFGGLGLVLFLGFIAVNGGKAGLALVLSGRSAQLTEAVAGSSKYLYYGPLLLVPAALVAFAIGWKRERPALIALSAALGLGLLVVRGPVGGRTSLLPLIGGFLVYFFLTRGRRPGFLAIVATLAIGLTLSAFLLGVRSARQREEVGSRAVAAQLAADPLLALDPLLQGQDAAEAPALAAALTLIPEELGHTYGAATASDLILRPIPRTIWAGKPKPPREQVIERLWPQLYSRGIANPEFSVLFTLYFDAGLVGVILGMFACGLVLRAGYAYFRRHTGSMVVRLAFALWLPIVIILLRDTPTDTLARAVFVLLPLYVGYRVASGRHRGAT